MVFIFVLTLHVLGAGLLFSIGVFSLLLTTKGSLSKERLKTIEVIEKLAPVAALGQLLTGSFMYLRHADKFNAQPVFWVKISLFVLSGFFATKVLKKKRMLLMRKKGDKINAESYPSLVIFELLVTLTIIFCGVLLMRTR